MSRRPLAFVSVLTLGDYVAWNWSLAGSHELPALISGLTLPPLMIALIWLAAVSLMRVLTQTTQHSRALAAKRAAARTRAQDAVEQPATPASGIWKDEQASARSSSKLAA
ncbi:MAG TPA: hypothetical protein VLJ42_09020 [Solirubrobacteraceae bacterium]|nr:hypothetical protein [Solirubrobacteraceae bacterium]